MGYRSDYWLRFYGIGGKVIFQLVVLIELEYLFANSFAYYYEVVLYVESAWIHFRPCNHRSVKASINISSSLSYFIYVESSFSY